MKLRLEREVSTKYSTHGILYVNGQRECHTLEAVVRPLGNQITGKTAIPHGHYKVVLNQSPRFKRVLPLLLNVPRFTGIRIHAGNTPHDTTGCILVGESYVTDFIGSSQSALSRLIRKMAKEKDITIDIVNAPHE